MSQGFRRNRRAFSGMIRKNVCLQRTSKTLFEVLIMKTKGYKWATLKVRKPELPIVSRLLREEGCDKIKYCIYCIIRITEHVSQVDPNCHVNQKSWVEEVKRKDSSTSISVFKWYLVFKKVLLQKEKSSSWFECGGVGSVTRKKAHETMRRRVGEISLMMRIRGAEKADGRN